MIKKFKDFKINESSEELKFEDIINMKQFLELAKGISIICMGEYGSTYYNPTDMKIAIVLGDSNPFGDDNLEHWIENTIVKDYNNFDKVDLEIDYEWVPYNYGKGEEKDWLIYDERKHKFVQA